MKYEPIPVTDKLAGLLRDKANLVLRTEQSRLEVARLTKLLNPQYMHETVRTVADIKDETSRKSGVITTGVNDVAEAARRDAELKRTLAGEPLAELTDTKSQLELAHRQWTAIEDAIDHINREIAREKTAIAIAYSKSLAPLHKDIMARLAKPMIEFQAAYLEAYALKRHLVDNDIGLRGLCLTLPEFLSTPNNPHSELADYFRALKSEGYIKTVPTELLLRA